MEKMIKKAAAAVFAAVVFSSGASAYAHAADRVYSGGEMIGIQLKTKGVIVEDVTEYEQPDGSAVCPASDAGILVGDVITHVDGIEINEPADMKKALDSCGGKKVTIKLERAGEKVQVTAAPYVNGDGGYELGLWLRDGLLGLGTITYYDEETGAYGALGHPISDSKTQNIIPIDNGTIYEAEITEIVKGKSGRPGQLHGDFESDTEMGTIEENGICGIFGKLKDSEVLKANEVFETAESEDVETGKAQIISAVSGKREMYDIEITRLYTGSRETGKSMMITVTDDDLLSITGGIVQGMSGSPIIQDGKLVGAVTHVLVNDPTRGYGIFIENMLDAAG